MKLTGLEASQPEQPRICHLASLSCRPYSLAFYDALDYSYPRSSIEASNEKRCVSSVWQMAMNYTRQVKSEAIPYTAHYCAVFAV